MNVLKNYNNFQKTNSAFVIQKSILFIILLLFFCLNVNAAEPLSTSSSAVETSDYFKVLFGLVFVIGLFLGSTYLFKRFGNGSMVGRGQLSIVDGLHLGNRERLVLVEVKDKQILLAITPGGINKLDSIDVVSSAEKLPESELLNPPTQNNQSQTEEAINA